MEKDAELIFYNAMSKIQKKYKGKIDIVKNLIEDISLYYFNEYYILEEIDEEINEEIDEKKIAEQISDIANAFLNNKKYKKITKVLNKEELEVVVSIAFDEICKAINNIERGEE